MTITRLRFSIIGAVFLLLAAALIAVGRSRATPAPADLATQSARQTTSSSSTSPTPALPDAQPLSALAGTITIAAGPHPDSVVITGDSAWVAGVGDENGTTVGRYDVTTAEPNGVVRIGNEKGLAGSDGVPVICAAMAGGYRAVWVVDCPARSLSRINADTGAVDVTVALPFPKVSVNSTIAAGEGGVFVLSSGALDNVIARIDPVTNEVSKMHAPDGAAALIAGEGALWVSSTVPGAMTRLDPTSAATEAVIKMANGERFLAIGAGSVWVLNVNTGVVSRIDPEINTVVATVAASTPGFADGNMTFGGGYLWLRDAKALVVQVDPATNTVLARYGPPAGWGGLAANDRALWLSSAPTNTIWRVPLQ